MFIDTHAHFDEDDGSEGIGPVLARARQSGVTRVVAVGGSGTINRLAAEAGCRFPESVSVALGFDRDEAEWASDVGVDVACGQLREMVASARAGGCRVVALGEMGLDFHYTPETADVQQALFGAQLELARELRLPVVVHSREADSETVAALSDHAAQWNGEEGRLGVLHCFTGNQAFADHLLALGFMISFSGIVTFRNADALRGVARTVPDGRMLIETDSPYLAPIPWRGKRNEPAYVRHVAETLASVRGVAVTDIAAVTTGNAERLFDLPPGVVAG